MPDGDFTDRPFEEAIGGLIEEAGLSLRAVARASGVDVSYVSRLRSGEAAAPPDPTIERLARAFGVRPDYFLEYRARRVAAWLLGEPDVLAALYRLVALPPRRRREAVRRATILLAGQLDGRPAGVERGGRRAG
jgi:transcriptional regulator with XRE-family HTH domain